MIFLTPSSEPSRMYEESKNLRQCSLVIVKANKAVQTLSGVRVGVDHPSFEQCFKSDHQADLNLTRELEYAAHRRRPRMALAS